MAIAPNKGRWNTETTRRSRQDSHESERRDPVAFWYAEALSQR